MVKLLKKRGEIMRNDTIAAISTARGKGGVAMIRISGDTATEIINKMF